MQVAAIDSAPRPHSAAHDLAALKRGGLSPAEQRATVASQFEAILLRQFLQDSVGSMMGAGSGGASGNVYGYMLTDSLAQKLSEGRGMGFAALIARQLAPRSPAPGAGLPESTQP